MRGSVVKKGRRYYIVYTVAKRQKWEKVPEPNTKKNAERLLAQRITEINRGEYREIKKVTFAEFAERWLRDYVDDPNHIKPSSAGKYHAAFRKHLMPFFGDCPLAGITPDIIQKFISALSRNNLAPQTIRNYLTPLTTMFKHAVQWGYLRSSPMPYVERPKAEETEMAFLSAAELRGLLSHIPGEWYSFFLAMAMSGMRVGEMLAMRWKNLNWEKGQYSVQERLYEGKFNTPKTRTSRRTVDLPPSVLEALKKHRAEQIERKLALGEKYRDEDLIFCRHNGTPIVNTDNLRKLLHEASKAAGCPPIRLHDLRHTYAALLIAQGESPKYIQRQLGHSSVQMTFDLYGHLMPEVHREAPVKLDRQVFGTG